MSAVRVLARLTARRLAPRTLWWSLGLAVMVAASGSAYRQTYPTAADRAALTSGIGADPAMAALLGPARDLSTVGGFLVWRVGLFVAVLMGVLGLLSATALTRGEEESGLREAVWAGALPRRAPLLVTAVGVAGSVTVVAASVAAVAAAQGAPAATCVSWAVALACVGWVFAGLGLVTAQLTGTRRAASGLAGTVVGVAYLVRAVADGRAGASQLRSWTPLGWYELVAPERDRAWTPVVALVAVALLGVLAAAALERRRDLGAAWWQERPGPALARPFPPGWPGALAGPASLATRLFAGAGLAWSLGLGAFGAVLAALAPDVGDLLRDNPAMADLVRSATSGGADDLGLAYLGMTFSLMTAAVSAVAVQGVLAARAEEVQGRAEPVLATPTPRTAWLGAHLLAGLLAAVAVAAVLGGASQLAWTAAGGGGTRVLLAGVNLVPVAACWAGVAVLAVGWWPRAAGASVWGALAASFLASFVAPLLGWPSAATAWSPFAHVEPVPAVGLAVVPALALLAAGAAAALLGAVGVRRRDVTP